MTNREKRQIKIVVLSDQTMYGSYEIKHHPERITNWILTVSWE